MRAEAEQEEQRALEEHPVLRYLERRRQLAEGDVELPEIGHRLELGLHVDLNVAQAPGLDGHLLEEATLEVLDHTLGDVSLVRFDGARHEAHAPHRTDDLPRAAR